MTRELISDTDLKRETVTEPPKRWRNKWRAKYAIEVCRVCGSEAVKAGEEFFGCCSEPFPSRDLAETDAVYVMQKEMLYYGEVLDDYLGAFPVDE